MLEVVVPSTHKKLSLSWSLKDNISLIVVLEAKDTKFHMIDVLAPRKCKLIYVVNTHINVNMDLKDVKLLNFHTLLNGLEKITMSANIPMLVCGDFR